MLPENITAPIRRIERDAGRVREIVGVLVKYGLTDVLDNMPLPGVDRIRDRVEDPTLRHLSREVRVRLALTDLGTTFIKAGQVLSTRADLVGPELASELSKLQMETPPEPYDAVKATVEQDLGRSIEEVFAVFEPDSFASASVAQVHRAELQTGETVAVKVQRQEVSAKVEADLSILETFAHRAEKHSDTLRRYQPVRLVAEFRRTLLHELDFNRERQNLETFERNFENDPTVRFPQTWPEYSSRRVLTMEFMAGTVGTQREALTETGEDLAQFAQRGARVYLEMIFRDRFYHADPHPGNLMLLPGGVVGILDCGMVGRIDEGLLTDIETLVSALTQDDTEGLTETLWTQTNDLPPGRREEMRADLDDLMGDVRQSGRDVDLSAAMRGLFEVFRKYRVTLRPGMTGLMRTLVLLDGTARQLTESFDLMAAVRPYQSEAIRRRLTPDRLLRRMSRQALEWDRLLERLPSDLDDTVRKMRSGEFRVGLEHRHLDAVANRLVLGIVASSLFLGSSLLWSLKAPPTVGGISVFGALGYVAGVVLAWVLYRAIRNSGKVAPRD